MVIFIVWLAFILLQPKEYLNHIKKYVKINIFVTWLCLLKILKYYNLIRIKNLTKHCALSIIYAGGESKTEKIDGCKNIPENWYATKVSKHIPSGFSMSIISSFRNIENQHGVSRGKDFIKNVL